MFDARARSKGDPTDMLPAARRGGGMADAMDSKSIVRKGVWVRIPPAALTAST